MMSDITLRSFLLAAIVICNCISWSASRHHFGHNTSGHRSRHRRQGARLFLPGSYVLPEGEGSGAWGPWGEASSCSRTCGGGVAHQQRICLEIEPDGRPRCTGGNKKYFSCNTQDCPGSRDFRSEQCSKFDNVSFKGVTYNWVPYTKAPNMCELNCMPRGERFYYRHETKVIDGTRCSAESLDVCVDGICQPVGCDMMLGSNAQEDKCRECRGNGTSCKTYEGVNDDEELRTGYNDLLLLPAGATSVHIAERGPSNNYLAIRSKTANKYYLNGDYRIDFPRSLVFAGAVWHYERSPQGFPAPDILRCQGPTNEPVYLSILRLDVNVGIRYEYSVPKSMVRPPNEQYSWVFEQFTPCSASCGGGTQSRNVTCRSRQELNTVDDSLCEELLRPASEQACAESACAPRWVEGAWGPCSKPCGEGGTQSRQVHCEKVIAQGQPSLVSEDECIATLGEKPVLHRRCNEGGNCPSWHLGPWAPCDKLCGEGKQSRNVTCHLKTNGRVEKLEESECAEERPPVEQPCLLHPCEGVDWILSDWSGCDTCLSKVRTRTAFCATRDNKVVKPEFCDYHPKPKLAQDCEPGKLPPCHYQWYASQWSNCSTQCGEGMQTRRVFCGLFNGANLVQVDSDHCDSESKYNDTKPCILEGEQCPAHWHASPWTACDKKCGNDGQQFRRVLCIRGGKPALKANDCDLDTILESNRDCNHKPCDADELIPVTAGSTQPIDEDDYEDCPEEGEYGDYEEEGVEAQTEDQTDADTKTSVTSDMTEEELMYSDSPSATGSTSSDITEEGSGDDLTLSTFIESEGTLSNVSGSGEEELETGSTISGSTESSSEGSSTSPSGSTETSVTESSTDFDSQATEVSASESDLTSVSEDDLTSASETETELTSVSGETDVTGSEASSSDITSSNDGSTTEALTEGSDATDSSTESVSTDLSSTDVTGTEESTETSTDITDTETTEDVTTESTTDSSTDSSTTEASTDETSELSSTEGSTDVSATEGTTDVSTDSSTDITSESGSTAESSTDGNTDASSESSSSDTGSTEPTLEESSASEGSTETVTEVSGSSEGTDSTEPSGSTETSSSTQGSSEAEGSSTTEPGGSTETDVGGTDGSTTELTGSSVEVTESSTSSDVTDETGSTGGSSTESSSTESSSTDGSTTEAGSTTEGASSTEGSTGESGSTELDESTTSSWGWTSTIEQFTPRKCRKRTGKPKCADTEFGCCFDNKTAAAGPFDAGCITPETCKETTHGCCPDGVSPAKGPKGRGCPSGHCEETLFGCCASDKKTPAQGNDQEGCPPPPPACEAAKFGCCADNKTGATGPKRKGCPENAPKPKPAEGCDKSKHGCCHDNVTAAAGPDGQGCPCNATEYGCCPDDASPAQGPQLQGCVMSCNSSAYGCCPDGETPAHGRLREGCCLSAPFGCCPDNINFARGPHFEGCGCQYSPYGCCPDNVTVARGYDNEGCGCTHTPHGCCPNRYTPALGPNFEGCQCYTYQFGCCPDGKTVAKGPQQLGCRCTDTEFGCCGDGQTPAQGADMAGCDCSSSKYGCCPDGTTDAKGEKFQDCTDKPENQQASCGLEKERGPCRNYTVQWFYDTDYGGCSRFWYGGCEGNLNRFASIEECRDVCIKPQGKAVCKLPKVKGVCEGYHPRWYYDSEREQCGQFVYGGCLGNDNNFESREDCQSLCEEPRNKDVCSLATAPGPCSGNFVRWAFDSESKRCQQFVWGGCEGNGNRFASESACIQQCDTPGTLKDECRLPREAGNCTEKQPKWFFDQSENRCMPFYFTGCNGNDNQFDSERECEGRCPKVVVQDTCTLPALVGECANYAERWYFDSAEDRCRQFYYGGCGGNGNNFPSENECQRRCAGAPTTTPSPVVTEPFRADFCFLEAERGLCGGSDARFHYDPRTGACRQFVYGGCGGNRNNFPTREHCESYCSTVQDICQLPMLVGPCEGSLMQWYYDARSDACSQFTYGGCQGNPNRFNSREECESRCKTAAPPTTPQQTTTPAIQQRVQDDLEPECRYPSSLEPCGREQDAWFYDSLNGVCTPSKNGACAQERNNYPSEEACERRCGVFKDIEICRYPVDPGACRGLSPKIYWDAASERCLDFNYGGCGGGPNRFSSVEECQSVCMPERKEPKGVPQEVPQEVPNCDLPVDTGDCQTREVYSSRRWYYSDDTGTCQIFAYVGCGGNSNNFNSFEECVQTCRRDNNIENEIPEPCDTYREECARMSCDFGVEERKSEEGCKQCVCRHPCSTLDCGRDERCTVDAVYAANGERRLQPVCRLMNKQGACPRFSPEEERDDDERCGRECNDDADCESGDKCCQRGCSYVCAPAQPAAQTYPTRATYPVTYPTRPPYTNPPTTPYYSGEYEPRAPTVNKQDTPSEVASEEGGLATLRCVFNGYPPPTISWQRGAITIDGSIGRYRILTDGALQIVSVYRNDSGVYICIANNGVGDPATQEVNLDVRDPVSGAAGVVGDENASVTGTLNRSLLLRCAAYGHPAPDVWWWKGDAMLPYSGQHYEMNRDGLLIRSLDVETLGVYTCQAFNGLGKPASWSVTVRAYRPADGSLRSPWLVARDDRTVAVTPRAPARVSPAARPTLAADDLDPNIIPEYVPPVYNVPISTSIPAERTTFPVGSELSLPCEVDGHPQPQVTWIKDGAPLEQSSRVQISEAHRLTIVGATTNDSGIYTCAASNAYSSHSSYVQINVEGTYVHPNCTDNRFFANCELIVKAKYCRHQYYAKFCCRSCTLAGQLTPQEMLSDQPRFRAWRK